MNEAEHTAATRTRTLFRMKLCISPPFYGPRGPDTLSNRIQVLLGADGLCPVECYILYIHTTTL